MAHHRDLSTGLLGCPCDEVSDFPSKRDSEESTVQLQCPCAIESSKSHSDVSGMPSCLRSPALMSLGGGCARV